MALQIESQSRPARGPMGSPHADPLDEKTSSNIANLDWTRDPQPLLISPYQETFRNVDWASTCLGPMATWSRDLRHTVRLMMADTSPVILYWGPKHTILYNEAYVPLIGIRHPDILGRSAPDVFPELWGQFENIIAAQRLTGRTETGQASMLLLNRHGFVEETFFNWKLIPLVGDEGYVVGSYGVPSDLTRDVIGLRRNDCVAKIAHLASKANDEAELWSAVIQGLQQDDKDIPFAMLYSVEEQVGVTTSPMAPDYHCLLQGCIGVDSTHPIARSNVDIRHDSQGLAPTMFEALHQQTTAVLDSEDPIVQHLFQGIDWQGYGLPCKQYAVVPISTNGQISAFLVAGLNPYRRYNDMYQEFLQLIADVIAPQISRLRLAVEVKRREELATRAAKDFERSETRLSRFAERSIVGLAVADINGKITYANDAWYRFSGVKPSTDADILLSHSAIDEDAELIEQWRRRILDEKSGGTFQIRSKEPFKQGNMCLDHRTGMCAGYADLNDSGEVESIMVFIMDISELKWTEQQLWAKTQDLELSSRKYRNFTEHCPLGVCRTDGGGNVVYGNDVWHSYYEFKRGEYPGPQPWLPYVHEDDVQACLDFFAKLQKSSGPEVVEFRLRDKTFTISEGGRIINNDVYVLATGFSEFKADGSVDYIDFWVTDISPQKMAAKVLTNKMEEALALKTQQERFIDMISHEIRNPLSAVLHCGEEVVETMKRASTTLDSMIAKLPPPAAITASHCTLQKHVHGALDAANTVLYCVQHQKQIVDDVLTLSKLDSQLLVVSPVPVQPISLIHSSLKIFEPELKMTDISLSIIEDESLDVLGADWVLLDPNRFLQIVINLVTNAIKFTKSCTTRNIEVTVSALDTKPAKSIFGVDYVPKRYTPAQSKKRSSSRTSSITSNDWKESFKEEPKIFAQASPKTHVEYGGSGLGLFISRQITELLGGEIGMASSPDQGTTFAFYVETQRTAPPNSRCAEDGPLVQLCRTLSFTADVSAVAPFPENQKEETEAPRRPSLARIDSKRRVLVVEDNLVNQKVLCKQLRSRDFVVQAANHGQEALEAIMPQISTVGDDGTKAFDVVLCDIEMPVMDGIEFARQVRALEASGELRGHLPIIAVTANVRSKQVSAAAESGMDGVTTKPYRIHELLEQIDRVCPLLHPG